MRNTQKISCPECKHTVVYTKKNGERSCRYCGHKWQSVDEIVKEGEINDVNNSI